MRPRNFRWVRRRQRRVSWSEETSLTEARDLFDTNFFGALSATTAALPHMRRQQHGRIIFISSVLGFLPAPFMGIYGATKHAIKGYAETLDHEVREFGIRSILVEPSFTATNLVDKQRETAQRLPDLFTCVPHVRRSGLSARASSGVFSRTSLAWEFCRRSERSSPT